MWLHAHDSYTGFWMSNVVFWVEVWSITGEDSTFSTKNCPTKARKDCIPTFSSYECSCNKQLFHTSNKPQSLIGIKMRISSWKPQLNGEEGPEYVKIWPQTSFYTACPFGFGVQMRHYLRGSLAHAFVEEFSRGGKLSPLPKFLLEFICSQFIC